LVRESLSARLDGEVAPLAADVVDRHVAGCADCRAFAADAESLHRRARVGAAEAVPDLSAAIMASVRPAARRADQQRVARWGLVVVGVTQLVAAVQVVVAGDGAVPIHVARELGALDAALAALFLLAGLGLVRAAGVLPAVGVLVGCLALATIGDLLAGDIAASGEVVHLPDAAGLFLLWVVAGRPVPAVRHGGRRTVGRLAAS
jgi:predicted anti-sigma-YlaC factor YlaD